MLGVEEARGKHWTHGGESRYNFSHQSLLLINHRDKNKK